MSVIRYHEAARSYGNDAWLKRNIDCRNITNQSFELVSSFLKRTEPLVAAIIQ
jgi:hypothetical protein